MLGILTEFKTFRIDSILFYFTFLFGQLYLDKRAHEQLDTYKNNTSQVISLKSHSITPESIPNLTR